MNTIKNRIKALLATENKKMKDIAPIIGKSLANLSVQLTKGHTTFAQAEAIADYLGYDIVFVKRKPE